VIVLQPLIRDRVAAPFADGFTWKPELGSTILVLDKDDLTARRTYELPAFSFFHLGDAWMDAGGTIRFDACIGGGSDNVFGVEAGRDMIQGRFNGIRSAELALIELSPDGRGKLTPMGVDAEFPRTDPRFAGSQRRFTVHAAGTSPGRPLFQGLAVRDWKGGDTRSFDLGPHQLMEEAVFVPRPGSAAEFDGWLLAPSLNLKARATELHVFDARRVDRGPLCTWRADAGPPRQPARQLRAGVSQGDPPPRRGGGSQPAERSGVSPGA
jgi:carotenoid cleavage dioxygenase-like enzyme